MGQLIDLSTVRAARAVRRREHVTPAAPMPEGPQGPDEAATFWLDVASPFTYLATERVERLHAELR